MTTTTMNERPQMRPGLVGPVILIGLGVVFLLNNLGMLGWGVWDTLFRLWPVLLIAIGLDIIVGRRSAAAALLIPAIMLIVFAFAIWSAGTWSFAGTQLSTTSIGQPLENATRAEIQLGIGVGQLRLAAADEPGSLIAGSVQTRPNERLTNDFAVREGVAFYTLRVQGATMPGFGGRNGSELWDLRLSPAVPLRLALDTGVGSANADLSGLNVTDLTVNTGVGQIDVILPAQGSVNATIDGGVGQTVVTIPDGVAARIEVSRGLGSVQVQGSYNQNGDVYLSPGYEQATNRVNLRVNGGVGSITIH